MSTLVDERVVTLEFNNKNFERNVAQSMETLDNLRESLDFDNVSREINKSFKSVDPNPLIKVLDKVEKKISVLDIMFVTFVANMTNKLINLGERLVKSLSVDQVMSGWQKYQQKSIAIGTLVSQGNDIALVTEQMQKLNDFTDQTSYEFIAMSENIGKFTAAGQGLEDSVDAMIGIANWAATAGVEAGKTSAAMYQISQAMSAGVMRLQDYKSIQTAGMDTLAFRKTVLETAVAMGKLNKISEDTYQTLGGTEFDTTQITTTLSEGWFDRELMMKTFKKYSKAFNEIQEYASLEENKDLTVNKVIEKFQNERIVALREEADRLAKVAEEAREAGKSAKEIAKAYKEAEEAAEKLAELEFGINSYKSAQETRTLTQAIQATKDAVSSNWMNISELIFGNYEQAKTVWSTFADDLWDIFAEGGANTRKVLEEWNKIGGRDDLFSLEPENLGAFWNLVDAIKSIIAAVKEGFGAIFNFGDTLEEKGQGVKKLTETIQKFSKKLIPSKQTLETIKNTVQAIASVLKVLFVLIKAAYIIAKPFLTLAIKLTNVLMKIINKLSNSITNTLDDSNDIIKVATYISKVIEKIIGVIEKAITAVIKFVSNFVSLETVKNIISSVFNAIKSVFELFAGSVFAVFGKIKNYITTTFGSVSDLAEKLKNSLEKIVDKIKSVVEKFNVFSKVGGTISNVSSTIVKNVRNTTSSLGSYVTSLFKSKKANKENTEVVGAFSDALILNSNKLGLNADSQEEFAETSEEATEKTSFFVTAINFVAEALKSVWKVLKTAGSYIISFVKYLKTVIQPFIEYLTDALPSITSVLEKVLGFISSFAKKLVDLVVAIALYLKNSGTLTTALSLLSKAFKMVASAVVKFVDYITNSFTSLPNIFDILAKAFKKLFELGKKLFNGIVKFFSHPIVKNVASTLMKSIRKIVGAITYLYDAIKIKVMGLFTKKKKSDVTKTGEEVTETAKESSNVLTALAKLMKSILRLATTLIDALTLIFNKISDGIRGIMTGKGSGINIREIISGAIFAVIGLNVAKGLITMLDVLRALLNPIEDLFDAFRQSQLAKKWKEIGNFFKSFGLAMLMITASLVIMASIPTKDLNKALKTMGIIFGALTGFVVLLSAVVAIIVKLSGGLKAGTKSIKVFGKNVMSNNAMISELASVLKSFSLLIISLGISLLLISFSLKNIAGMEWSDIKKGLTVIGILMGGIIVMISVISMFKKSELKTAAMVIKSFALAMLMFIIPIKILGKMDWEELGKGLSAIGFMMLIYAATMATIIAASKVSEGQKVAVTKISMSILAFAGAAMMMAWAIHKVGTLDWESINKALTAFVPLLAIYLGAIIIAVAIGKNSKSAVAAIVAIGLSFAAFAGALVTMAIATKIMDSISMNAVLKMSMMMIIMGTIFLIAEGLATPKRGASMILLSFAFAMLASAFIELAMVTVLVAAIPTKDLKKGLGVIALVTAIFIGMAVIATLSIIGSVAVVFLGAAMIEIATSFLIFAVSIKEIAAISWKDLKKGIGIITGITAIFIALAALSTFAIVGTIGITILGAGMILIGLGLLTIIKPLKMLAKIKFKTLISGLIKMGLIMAGLAVVIALITPLTPLLLLFSIALMALVGAFLALAVIADLSSATITRGIINICNDIDKALPNVFATIKKFMLGLFELLETLVPSWVDSMVTIFVKICNGLADRMDEIFDAIENVLFALFEEILFLLGDGIQWLYDNVVLKIFNLLKSFAKKIINFFTNKIVQPIVKFINKVIKKVNKMLPKRFEIPTISISANDIDSSELDDSLAESAYESAVTYQELLENAMKETNITGIAKDFADELNKNAKTLSKGGFFGETVLRLSLSNLIDELKETLPEDMAMDIGKQVMAGIAKGMISFDQPDKVYEYVANLIHDKINEALEIHSPSRMMYDVGEYIVKGIGVGMEDANLLESSSDTLALNAETSIKDKIKQAFAKAIEFAKGTISDSDIDNAVTIKPVVDMTDIERNKKNIANLFNGTNNPTIGSTLRLATSVSNSSLNNSNKPVKINQNGVTQTQQSQSYVINNTFNVDGNTDVRTLAKEISNIMQRSIDRRNYNYGK